MQLSLHPYQLQFKFPFRIAHGVRTHTNVVYVKLEHKGLTAWGEATLPPYLPETQQSVIIFLTAFSKKLSNAGIEDWRSELQKVETNMSAKAALDMALWSLKAQLENKPIGQLLGITETLTPYNTYTIGVSTPAEMKQKIEAANNYGFEIFKLKLDGENDEAAIENFKAFTNKKFAVDVNQGWKNLEEAKQKLEWLVNENCLLVEQPLSKTSDSAMKLLKQKSKLPLYADESCQRLADVERIAECFHGINIKLMKCGGITEALEIIKRARQLNLNILIGCMSESSIGCTAAAHLTPLADYADLDGPYLISNDPFEGMKIAEGRIQLNALNQKNTLKT